MKRPNIGVVLGTVALGAGGFFVAGELVSAFNAHAANPTLQFLTTGFGAVAGFAATFYAGCKALVGPQLKHRGGIISAPIMLAITTALSGLGSYGGYRAGEAAIDYSLKRQDIGVTKSPSPAPAVQ